MKQWVIRIIIFLILIFVGLDLYVIYGAKKSKPSPITTPSTTPTISELAKKEFTLDDKIALASYYGWYYKSKIWAKETKAEHPMAGSYDPGDDKTIDYQLSLAKDTGLDGFIYSWSGNKNDDATLLKMLTKAETSEEYSNFKIAVLYENVNYKANQPTATIISELSQLVNLGKNHPAFLKLNGLPVIFVYNPQGIPVKRWQEIWNGVRTAEGESYLVAMPDNWDVADDYFEYFHTITTYADKYISLKEISAHYADLKKQDRPLIATLIGGTSRIQKDGYDIDRSNGQYLEARYEIAKKNNADWLYITSWNEWYEYAQVEPSVESKFETVKYLREIIATYKNTTADEPTAKLTLNDGKTKNEGPSNVYCLRCGAEDQSPPLIFILKPGEQESVGHLCKQISGYLVNNTKVQN